MVTMVRPYRMDVAYVTALLLVASVPLVLLRAFPALDGVVFQVGLWTSLVFAAVILWRWEMAARAQDTAAAEIAPKTNWPIARLALLTAGLFALALMNFCLPMRRQFWAGVDEHILFTPTAQAFWSDGMDRFAGRPMALVQVGLAHLLTPERIEGFLLVALFLCVANALLLAGILRHFSRDSWLVPTLGAALFVINPCDPSRFYVIWTTNCYWTALLFGQLAAWLYLESGARANRWLLAAACAALLASGLSNEGILPLMCLGPVLLWLSGRGSGRMLAWSLAWYGSMALLAVRFVVHLRVDDVGYQAGMLARTDLSLERLYENGLLQVQQLTQYFEFSGPWRFHVAIIGAILASLAAGCASVWAARRWLADSARRTVPIFAALAVIAGALIAMLASWQPPTELRNAGWVAGAIAAMLLVFASAPLTVRASDAPPWRGLAFGLIVAFVAVLLGLAPYMIVGGLVRTQFLAGPAQAALLALALGCVAACGPRRLGAGVGIVAAGWLIAVGTVTAWERQEKARDEVAGAFEKAVDVLDQVYALSPNLAPDTVILFLVDSPRESPCGYGAALELMSSRFMSGAFLVQATIDPTAPLDGPLPNSATASFSAKGVRVKSWNKGENLYDYGQMIIYRLGRDGDAALLTAIPESLLPKGALATGYAPLHRMHPGPIAPLAYYRLPRWEDAPHDVLDYRTGIRLGANWAGLRFHDGKLSRWARDGAEVLINPAGTSERTLTFVLDPARTPQPCTLQALDDADRVVASTPAGAGLVHLTLPLKSDCVQRLRLRLVTSVADGPHHFRILRAGDDVPPHPKYAGVARKVRALCGPDVGLTGSWHALEVHGATSFRWVDNDAGLVATTLGRPATLLVDVEPGPSLGGKPGELTVREMNGSVLVKQVLAKAERLRIPLPAVPGASAEVRLFIEGGGLPIPRDPRVLNFRVLRAELSDDE